MEKIVYQVLAAHGVMSDDDLRKCLENVEICSSDKRPMEEIFRKINEGLRSFGMEIRSMRRKINDRWVQFHAVVNIEDDFVAKDYGSPFDATELKFFADIVSRLLLTDFQSAFELDALDSKPHHWRKSRTDSFLLKLKEAGWLGQKENNFWELGVRSYLELNGFLAAVAEENSKEVTFPQVIMH